MAIAQIKTIGATASGNAQGARSVSDLKPAHEDLYDEPEDLGPDEEPEGPEGPAPAPQGPPDLHGTPLDLVTPEGREPGRYAVGRARLYVSPEGRVWTLPDRQSPYDYAETSGIIRHNEKASLLERKANKEFTKAAIKDTTTKNGPAKEWDNVLVSFSEDDKKSLGIHGMIAAMEDVIQEIRKHPGGGFRQMVVTPLHIDTDNPHFSVRLHRHGIDTTLKIVSAGDDLGKASARAVLNETISAVLRRHGVEYRGLLDESERPFADSGVAPAAVQRRAADRAEEPDHDGEALEPVDAAPVAEAPAQPQQRAGRALPDRADQREVEALLRDLDSAERRKAAELEEIRTRKGVAEHALKALAEAEQARELAAQAATRADTAEQRATEETARAAKAEEQAALSEQRAQAVDAAAIKLRIDLKNKETLLSQENAKNRDLSNQLSALRHSVNVTSAFLHDWAEADPEDRQEITPSEEDEFASQIATFLQEENSARLTLLSQARDLDEYLGRLAEADPAALPDAPEGAELGAAIRATVAALAVRAAEAARHAAVAETEQRVRVEAEEQRRQAVAEAERRVRAEAETAKAEAVADVERRASEEISGLRRDLSTQRDLLAGLQQQMQRQAEQNQKLAEMLDRMQTAPAKGPDEPAPSTPGPGSRRRRRPAPKAEDSGLGVEIVRDDESERIATAEEGLAGIQTRYEDAYEHAQDEDGLNGELEEIAADEKRHIDTLRELSPDHPEVKRQEETAVSIQGDEYGQEITTEELCREFIHVQGQINRLKGLNEEVDDDILRQRNRIVTALAGRDEREITLSSAGALEMIREARRMPVLPVRFMAEPLSAGRVGSGSADTPAVSAAQARKQWLSLGLAPAAIRQDKATSPPTVVAELLSGTVIRDRGNSLETSQPSQSAAIAMAAIADARGWKVVTITSTTSEFAETLWLEARKRGLEVTGHEPSAKAMEALERWHAEQQPAALTKGVADDEPEDNTPKPV